MNPGSLSSPRNGNPPTYGIIELSSSGEITMNIVTAKQPDAAETAEKK